MYYDPFVLPFTIGLNILLIYLVIKYARWIRTFSPEDKRTIRRNLFSLKTLKGIYAHVFRIRLVFADRCG